MRFICECCTRFTRLQCLSACFRFRPPSATVVSAKPFSHGTGTLRSLQKEMATYRHWSVSLWRDPDDVSHCRLLSPDKTEWRLISATLCGWRYCFMADQLWFMTRIREEEEEWRLIVPSSTSQQSKSLDSIQQMACHIILSDRTYSDACCVLGLPSDVRCQELS